MIEWKFIDDEKPTREGECLVLWSEPYCKNMRADIMKFYQHNIGGGSFLDSPTGANEIIFWAEIPDFPDIEREGIRTRLVRK
jgi:hypothetical protein